MKKLLFICMGNSCRSPMASFYFNSISGRKKAGIISDSAGLLGDGMPISSNAAKMLRKLDISSEKHLSKKVTLDLIKSSDWVLTMQQSQKEYLIENFKQYKDRIFSLQEFAGFGDGDIEDPVGRSEREYERVFGKIKTSVDRIIEKIGKMES